MIALDLQKVMEYTDEILEVVDSQEEYTRSDLQARIDAIVRKIILDTEKRDNDFHKFLLDQSEWFKKYV